MRKDKTPKPNFPFAPLRATGTPHTVRLQALMEQQQKAEIGQRIRDLRESSPHTNRSIADAVDVSERAVTGWISGRGVSWEHVEAVAELFRVDATWLWSGREKGETPDPFAAADRIAAVEAKLDRVLAMLDARDPDTAEPESEIVNNKGAT